MTDRQDQTSQNANGHHDYSSEMPEKSLLKWPPGYWEEYAALRAQAREACGDSRANICVLRNGLFEVRVYAGDTFSSGPQCSDRIQALKAFIAQRAGN
jgi:hypothetical protein